MTIQLSYSFNLDMKIKNKKTIKKFYENFVNKCDGLLQGGEDFPVNEITEIDFISNYAGEVWRTKNNDGEWSSAQYCANGKLKEILEAIGLEKEYTFDDKDLIDTDDVDGGTCNIGGKTGELFLPDIGVEIKFFIVMWEYDSKGNRVNIH